MLYFCAVQKVVLYVLLLATLLPVVSPWGTIMYYNANKAYIARVLCENRNRPQLHCDGKCYLAKKLKAQQDRQDKDTTRRVENAPTITLFCSDQFAFDFGRPAIATLTHRVPDYLLKSYATSPRTLFQPPRA